MQRKKRRAPLEKVREGEGGEAKANETGRNSSRTSKIQTQSTDRTQQKLPRKNTDKNSQGAYVKRTRKRSEIGLRHRMKTRNTGMGGNSTRERKHGTPPEGHQPDGQWRDTRKEDDLVKDVYEGTKNTKWR